MKLTRLPIFLGLFTVTLLGTGIFAVLYDPPVRARGDVTLGPESASVVVTELADFRCRFCQELSVGAVQQLIDEFVEPGHVQLRFQHLPILGPASVEAAEASECAAAQGQFWEFYDYVYGNWGTDVFGNLNLKRVAGEIELDTRDFNRCLDTHKMLRYVEADQAEAEALGFNQTPIIVIGNKVLIGLREYDEYKTVIREELAAAGVAVN
jgi:protein-disulfide isomerase